MRLQKLYNRHRHTNVYTRLKFKSSKQSKIGVTKKILFTDTNKKTKYITKKKMTTSYLLPYFKKTQLL